MVTKQIIVSNAKGGCGKTTIATNIASYYASRGNRVRLFDHDAQGASMHWNERRSKEYAEITVVNAYRRPDTHMTRSWQMRIPLETDVVVIDTPAGLEVMELVNMLREHDILIIPVLPSPIDIQATAYFIKDILLIGKARKKQLRIAVVANRVRKNTLMYHSLEQFLFTLKLPFVTSLRDTQFYTKAIELGIGIMDLKYPKARVDQEQWAPLIRWIDSPSQITGAEIRPLFNHKISS